MKNKQIQSSREELLPDGWIKTKINVVADNVEKINPKKYPDTLYHYCDINSIDNSKLQITNPKQFFGRDAPSRARQLIKTNDILFATVRTYLKNIAIVSNELNAQLASTGFCVIRPKINYKFVFYYVQTKRFLNKLNKIQRGTNYPAVKNSDVMNSIILVPPPNEQKRIVSKIESMFAHIDILEKSLKSVRSQMGQYKQLVLKLAFKGKLVLHRPDTSWKCVKISEICKLIGGGTPSRRQTKYFGGDIVWLTPTEISKTKIILVTNSKEKITKKGLAHSSAKIIPKDAVLLTSRASIGYVAIAGTNLSTNQGFMSFVCNNSIHNYFLAYWLVSNKRLLKQRASGTTFKEISKSKMREFSILIPSIPEQKRIVSKIKSIFTHVDMTDEHVTRLQTTLATLRQSVLQYAFEGNLVSQDPNDEPAYKLLGQIGGRI